MSLFVSSLNSGSNGNCYYVGDHRDAVLIDAGISCRETERRMTAVGLNIRHVRAIFISHEHTDHICGVITLSKKYGLPVYTTNETYAACGLSIDPTLLRPIDAEATISIGELKIRAFKKRHDACDPHSFMVSSPTVNVGVFTDIGAVCENLVYHFRQCNAAFLEANYDEDMLANGKYPYYLKKRIRGGFGHLSNREALDLCLRHRPTFMTHLFLAHLSRENNSPELVHNLFSQHLRGVEVVVAPRHQATPVFNVHPNLRVRAPQQQQLTLF